jgi:hypothetical protein
VLGLVGLVACGSGGDDVQFDTTSPTTSPPVTSGPVTADPSTTGAAATAGGSTSDASSSSTAAPADVTVAIDMAAPGAPISPDILGFSSALSADDLRDAGVQVNSWGGNPSTRYNYELGHAWNHGADYEFRNTNYGTSGDESRRFLGVSADAGIASRVAVPTLGWVAKDDLDSTCSFPDGAGGCLDREQVGDCAGDGPRADPRLANVESTPEQVVAWVEGLLADGLTIEYLAMDNEPELWGGQHYDVHPTCPTYEELLDKYLTYATALRAVAPDSALAGPVMCCWYDYWRTAPGPADGSGTPFLDWFLSNVAAHDAEFGQRTLDVVDVHYYPQSGVYNDDTSPETNAKRLRSTRSLWDPDYRDESWITEPIRFIPRIKETIERTYPDTPLFISEWNFGAETSMNGALAIADALGIFGREGVDAAAYWRNPPVGSPGWMAFKMHGNYDGQGSRFGGQVLPVTNSDLAALGAYAALDDTTGTLRVMLINKQPDEALAVQLQIDGIASPIVVSYTYGPADLEAIVTGEADVTTPLELPPYSITLLEIPTA